jgi:ubiquinone/menaquinone biosynthesis C-methylase UbiE
MTGKYIHGSTDAREVARLEKQGRWTAQFTLPALAARAGEWVLDLATGVGAMAGQIRLATPGVRLIGVDLRLEQLRIAQRNHPGIPYVNGDGSALPFRTAGFDRVHCSWLLEHVRDPVAILREVHRVLRPGGTCVFVEVDNATFRIVPEDPEILWVMDALNRTQLEGGGDPYVGQKLGRFFAEAGFANVEIQPIEHHGTRERPAAFLELAEEFAEIFEGLDEALGPNGAARAQEAARRLVASVDRPDGEFHYTSVRACATR